MGKLGRFIRRFGERRTEMKGGRTEKSVHETMAQAQERAKDLLRFAREQRMQDLAAGRSRGRDLFSEGQLGRLEQGRSPEIAQIIARRQAESKGYTPEEMSAFRGQQLPNVQRQLATNLRNMRSAQTAAGVFGPTAMRQQMAARDAATKATGDIERDLFLQNIGARRQGLSALEQAVQHARGEELGREKFNIGQLGREKFGQLGTELGYAGLGARERAGASQQALGEASAALGAKVGKK